MKLKENKEIICEKEINTVKSKQARADLFGLYATNEVKKKKIQI